MIVKVKSVQKIAIVYYHVETDLIDFPEFRRDESGQWERSIGESWESWYDEGVLEEAFQNYIAGMPKFRIEDVLKDQLHTPLADGVYHIEYINDHLVRLTKKVGP